MAQILCRTVTGYPMQAQALLWSVGLVSGSPLAHITTGAGPEAAEGRVGVRAVKRDWLLALLMSKVVPDTKANQNREDPG